jgi:hypothetical protein
MMTVMEIGELRMAQEDGGQPTTLAAGNAPAKAASPSWGPPLRFFSDSFDVLCMEPARDAV